MNATQPDYLQLMNTLGLRLETFESRTPGEVRIFTCGPSTYRRPHIGNYRSFLYEDLLVRYLEYLGFRVLRVINFTDVEDKTLSEAVEQGESVGSVTGRVQERFFEEADLLRLKLPDEIPRATTSVDTAVEIIEALTAKGYAYRHDGKYYFDASRVKGFGRLYGLDTSRWPNRRVRFGRDTYEGRRWNLGDFVLWHGVEAGGVMPEGSSWDTAIGSGRPSWNVQDPAMIVANLGPQIDIQCGGIDNLFRHHDYNIAVMEAYSGREFARYFLHGEHLIVDGEVMSKSKGNVLYTEHVLHEGYEPHHLRYFLMHEHYRAKLNFTWDAMAQVARWIDRLREVVSGFVDGSAEERSSAGEDGATGGSTAERQTGQAMSDGPAATLRSAFESAMNHDLSAGRALSAVFDELSRIDPNALSSADRRELVDTIARIDSVVDVLR